MKHKLNLSIEERINAWLDLSEFIFHLMKKTLSRKELEEKIEKIREEHLRADYLFLSNLGDLENVKK